MEENILIQGQKIRFKARILLLTLLNTVGGVYTYYAKKEAFWDAVWKQSAAWVRNNVNALDKMLLVFLVPYIAAWIVCYVLIILYSLYGRKTSLTVTDRRIYGKNGFGKNVDIPLGDVSAIRYGSHKGIAVVTNGKTIRFPYLKNRKELYEALHKPQAADDEPKGTGVLTKAEDASFGVDEIKKYKELLDAGVITQDEFDAKKKQLLGL